MKATKTWVLIVLLLISSPLARVCAAELPADIKNILLKMTSAIVDTDFGGFQEDLSGSNPLSGDAESRLSPLSVSPLQLYFPLNNGDIKNYQAILGTTYYAAYSYSQAFYNGRTCYLERDSADGSQAYYGYSGDQLQMYGATVDSQMIAFDTPLNILNDSILNNGGSLQSSTTLTVQGIPVTVNLTVVSTLADSVTIPLGKADNCRSINMNFSYSAPGESETIEIRDVWILAPNIGKLRIAVMDQFLNQLGWFTISGGTVGGKSVGEILNPSYPLSTSKAGSGSGTISSTPSGINCGSSCSFSYASGTNVTLTATANSGSTFAGWSGGGCSGTGQCTVTMNASKSVTATFSLNTYAITLPPTTNGTISCNPMTVSHGSTTSCIITPNTGYHFVTLTDNGTDVTSAILGNTYTISNVVSNHTISAAFAINTYTLAIIKAGTGSGTVTGVPGGINCGNICRASYVVGAETPVTLTAIPSLGSTFTGWSGGGCAGIGNCSLIMNDNIQLTSLFANPWGDVNNDGKIDLTDAILSLQVLSNMDTTGKTITIEADANNDSKIGMAEAVYILQKVAGWRDHSMSSCYNNLSCPNGLFCEKEIGNCAGAGVCSPMGGACTTDYNPVCGCNGMTYSNACSALGSGVSVAYLGICN